MTDAGISDYALFTIARAVHVLAVLYWIGGVAFVTTVLIPSLRANTDAQFRLQQFELLEGRFALQAKITTTLALLSGVYMTHFLDVWWRYGDATFWWMHLMTAVWVLFALVLFVLEPLFLHEKFKQWAMHNSEQAFKRLHTMHKLLLTVSTVAVFGAVLGAHGAL